jgi:hypothetical protein
MSQSLIPTPMTFALDFEQAMDRENPRSLINIVPTHIEKALSAIPKNFFEMSLEELSEKAAKGVKEETLELLRTSWWIEYNRCQKTQTRFNAANVYGGITLAGDFKSAYVGNSFRLLFMITPPVDYQVHQHRILTLAHQQEIEILKMPHMKAVYSKDGEMIGEEIDTKLLAVKQKIGETMRNRLQGMPINRTMQVNQNFNGPIPDGVKGGARPLEQMDESELRDYISELKGEKGIQGNAPRFKDVGETGE